MSIMAIWRMSIMPSGECQFTIIFQYNAQYLFYFILLFRCKHNCYNRDIALNVLATRPRRSRALTLGLYSGLYYYTILLLLLYYTTTTILLYYTILLYSSRRVFGFFFAVMWTRFFFMFIKRIFSIRRRLALRLPYKMSFSLKHDYTL